ncbi:MAG: PilZ domain-containing protein [Candidatus Omnitrophica bacterium]|nr:PilZ domain-containing protein [Candidatus Omnitrophota bacterium]
MAETDSGSERRKRIRYKCNMDVITIIRVSKFAARYGSAEHVTASVKMKAKVIDLSLGGAQIETEEILKSGTPVTIAIETPYSKKIKGKAIVVWVKKPKDMPIYNIGLEFRGLGWLQRFRLKRFIKWLSIFSIDEA